MNEYEAGKAAFQALARNCFIKVKQLELEAAKKSITAIYIDKFLTFIENNAELQIADLVDNNHITKINSSGGPTAMAALAWRTIIARSATPADLSVITEMSTEADFITNTALYLEITPADLRHDILEHYIEHDTNNIMANFITAKEEKYLNELTDNLRELILTTSPLLTSHIYNTYSRHQRKKEVTTKLRAQLKAQDITTSTELTSDLLEKDDNVDAPTLKGFVKEAVETQLKAINKHTTQQNTHNPPSPSPTLQTQSTLQTPLQNHPNLQHPLTHAHDHHQIKEKLPPFNQRHSKCHRHIPLQLKF